MPARAAIEHVEYSVLAYEDKVTLDLIIELVWDLDAAHVVGPWLGPLATDLARLDDIWNEFRNSLGYTNPLEESPHDMS